MPKLYKCLNCGEMKTIHDLDVLPMNQLHQKYAEYVCNPKCKPRESE